VLESSKFLCHLAVVSHHRASLARHHSFLTACNAIHFPLDHLPGLIFLFGRDATAARLHVNSPGPPSRSRPVSPQSISIHVKHVMKRTAPMAAALHAWTVGVRFRSGVSAFSTFHNRVPSKPFGRTQAAFHPSTALGLNRFLFDPSEVTVPDGGEVPTVTLSKDDYRTVHAAKILGLQNGDCLRAGVVAEGGDEDGAYGGCVTDQATIEWLPEGKIKKACPTKNGDPPGSLRIALESLVSSTESASADNQQGDASTPVSVSLILALPRPLQLGRMLPMISQMGVEHLVLTAAKKVPKDYFGSHLFRKPHVLRKLLIEGLCQSGDVKIPQITVAKRLKPFMEDDLDAFFPVDEYARVIAHPQRVGQTEAPKRMKEITFPSNRERRRLVVAVGPEGGWEEPYELDMFEGLGFQQITMGTRVLRSDVAVVSLLGLAHEVCSEDIERR
jgi:RsmE family RNA methyltransferase